VLKGWPAVRGRVPNATLVVYYGFSPAFVTWGARHIPAFDAWRAEIERLLGQPGVDYRGMVGHDELARGYARAGFVLYPTTYPETGCVSVMKAMALGAIPVTSRFAGSVVPELTVHFDLGPATPRRADAEASILLDDLKPAVDAADVAWQADFAAAAADAAARAAAAQEWRDAREALALDSEATDAACALYRELDHRHGILDAMARRVREELADLAREEVALRAAVAAEAAAAPATAALAGLGLGGRPP